MVSITTPDTWAYKQWKLKRPGETLETKSAYWKNGQWNPDFSNLQRKQNWPVFDWGEGKEFWFELSGGSKK